MLLPLTGNTYYRSQPVLPLTGPVLPTPLQADAGAENRTRENLRGKRIHFMGAGGIGVSALMELAAARGAVVSGCDCSSGGQVPALRSRGIAVANGHHPDHVGGCDELVHTAALTADHPELQRAKETGKPFMARMRMLGRLLRGTRAICVTGAHGKTTTTWLIANMLIHAGRDPSVLLGGTVKAMNGNVRVGGGQEFVAEVDESDNRLHEVVPTIPVITNIDNDHLDNYGTVDAIEEALTRFMRTVDYHDPLSILIGCGDDERVKRALATAAARSRRPILPYGLSAHCEMRGVNLRPHGIGWLFDVSGPFGLWTDFELPMPGQHNVLNALAALSVGWRLNIPQQQIRESFKNIERVGRRFEIKGIKREVRIVDDYGHHPTEIEATLRAARTSTTGRLAVLFQPHRYTRTQALLEQFATCFHAADTVFLLPIYAASEAPIAGVDHAALAAAIRAAGQRNVLTLASRAEAVAHILKWVQPGDTVLTQGAGDVTRAGDELVSGL